MELHAVHYNTQYLKLEQALRQVDGVIVIVYFVKLQTPPNIFLKNIIDALSSIKIARTSIRLVPIILENILQPFNHDYFIYWGSITTSQWSHSIMWLVSREPIGISKEQIDEFRKLCDVNGKAILENCRPISNRQNRNIFHVCPSGSLHATLLPISRKQLVQSSKIIADSDNPTREII
ncbi:hypothetical protein M0804_007482 [Polistes exclamans]|nr:hypothetical protein M0804_007482 [Polistes exclamans]